MIKMPSPAFLKALLRRIPPATSRNLWLLTAAAVAIHNTWVIYSTQDATALLVFSVLCWWGPSPAWRIALKICVRGLHFQGWCLDL